MASVKLVTLAIRTVAKPISTRLKHEAREHPFFRKICVQVAQSMYRTEMRLGTFVLGQPPRIIKPLSETKAIDNGANFIAESFLFTVAASLIIAEAWRSSSKESKRREGVADRLEDSEKKAEELEKNIIRLREEFTMALEQERARSEELAKILENIVNIGLRGGWVAFQDSPFTVPQVELTRRKLAAPPYPQDSEPPEQREQEQ